MKYPLLIILVVLLTSCTEKVTKADLHHINGYWEIEKVEFSGGEEKTYDLNTTVDYFTFDGSQGYRKKVQPKADGSFATSDDAEPFVILERDGAFIVRYKNALSEWEEQIETLSDDKFSVVNTDNIRYYYKRFNIQILD